MTAIHIAVHGGAGGSSADNDGCATAAAAGEAHLKAGGSALDAVITAVVAMENDGRYNAGRGSVLCLDGRTVEMDAAVMDTRGTLGAVACIRKVRNPVRVAAELAKTPHHFLAGEGATKFAEVARCEMLDAPQTATVLRKHATMLKELKQPPQVETSSAMQRYWNYPLDWQAAIERYGCGTVGAVACDRNGQFAVATSTGGCAPSLLGRVGDTPLIGCGFYAGAAGAIAATGIGEAIMEKLLARTVYGWIEAGVPLREALSRGIALFPHHIEVGLIGVTAGETAATSNRDMPVHVSNG